MKTTMRVGTILCSLLVASFATVQVASAAVHGYPSTEHASFLVDVPDDWEITPGESEGDYVTMVGPTGATISMRTIPGTADDMKAAIEDTEAFLGESYSSLTLTAAQDVEKDGLPGFQQGGTGKDKSDGHDVLFALAWLALKDGHIGEIWAVVTKGDPGAVASRAARPRAAWS
jgi:hypothetical protein